jgi:hypothetical protein
MKTAIFEAIDRPSRREWERWAYASYLLGVEMDGGKCVTKLGVPMFYREGERRYVDIDLMDSDLRPENLELETRIQPVIV